MLSASWRCIIYQVENLKYLGIAFTSDENQGKQLDVCSRNASAVMQALHHSVVSKLEQSRKSKLSMVKTIFVPILTYSHESWVIAEKLRSQMQASKIKFLQKINGITTFNLLRNSLIRYSLDIEPLLLSIEISQLTWFGYRSRMFQEWLPIQTLCVTVNGKIPVGRPRTR